MNVEEALEILNKIENKKLSIKISNDEYGDQDVEFISIQGMNPFTLMPYEEHVIIG